MKEFINEFSEIRQWGYDRKLSGDNGSNNITAQMCKVSEEVGELSRAVLRDNKDAFCDAVGDIVIALTTLASMKDIRIEECINLAFKEIENRGGKMTDGIFIKDEDIDTSINDPINHIADKINSISESNKPTFESYKGKLIPKYAHKYGYGCGQFHQVIIGCKVGEEYITCNECILSDKYGDSGAILKEYLKENNINQ